MLTIALAAVLLAEDTRRVEVSPGLELPYGEVDFDTLKILPDGKAIISSTRETASSRTNFAGELAVGTRLTVVFNSRARQPRHSIAGPFEVVAGDGPLRVTAKAVVREPVEVQAPVENPASPQRLTLSKHRLLLPLPSGVIAHDDRATDAKISAPPKHWAVPVPLIFETAEKENAATIGGLLEGLTYSATASAAGFEPQSIRIPPESKTVRVMLEPIEPLVVTVVDPLGRPLAGVDVATREQPSSEFRVYYPITMDRESDGQTDAQGSIHVTDLVGGRVYDMFVDGGAQGRALVSGVKAGDSKRVTLASDPPLKVTIKNIPPSEGSQVVAQEYWSKKYAMTSTVHGPFDVTGDELTVNLPAPLGEVIHFKSVGEASWKRKLIINARGRAAVIDLADPAEEVYVAPGFAPLKRTVTVRFVPDDRETDVNPQQLSLLGANLGVANTFVISRRRPSDDEKAGRSYRAEKFAKSDTNEFSKAFPTDTEVRFNFERLQIDGYVISGRDWVRVFPGDDDITVEVPLVPAVDYELDFADFADKKMSSARVPFASAQVVRSGNDASWISKWNGKLQPSKLRMPAEVESLLLINDDPDVIVKRLDGVGGSLKVDWTKIQRTTIQAVGPDGDKLSTRIDGFVVPNSSIKKPVSVYYESERTGPSADKRSSIEASQVVMNLHADEPVWVVVSGYGQETAKEVIAIAPGEHHIVETEITRTLWVDLLNPDGTDFRDSGRNRLQLFYNHSDGIEIDAQSGWYDGRFVGVPSEGPFRLQIYFESYGYAETTIDPGTAEEIGIVVKLPARPGADVELIPDTRTSTGSRKRNREFMREKGRGR